MGTYKMVVHSCKSDLNVRMPFGIFLQSLFCKYSHRAILTV